MRLCVGAAKPDIKKTCYHFRTFESTAFDGYVNSCCEDARRQPSGSKYANQEREIKFNTYRSQLKNQEIRFEVYYRYILNLYEFEPKAKWLKENSSLDSSNDSSDDSDFDPNKPESDSSDESEFESEMTTDLNLAKPVDLNNISQYHPDYQPSPYSEHNNAMIQTQLTPNFNNDYNNYYSYNYNSYYSNENITPTMPSDITPQYTTLEPVNSGSFWSNSLLSERSELPIIVQITATCSSNAPQSQPLRVNNFDGFEEPIQNTWPLNPRKRQHGDDRTVRQFYEVDRDVNGNQLVDPDGKVVCKMCGGKYKEKGIKTHSNACKRKHENRNIYFEPSKFGFM